jgi:hypothetical protein
MCVGGGGGCVCPWGCVGGGERREFLGLVWWGSQAAVYNIINAQA